MLALLRSPHGEVKDDLSDDGNKETENAFPADHFEWFERVAFQDPFFKDKLRGGKDLCKRDKENAEHGMKHFRSIGWDNYIPSETDEVLDNVTRARRKGMCVLVAFEEGSCQSDQSNAKNDKQKREPVVQVECTLEEEDAEEANKQDKSSPRHLIDRGSHKKEPDVHQCCSRDIATRW